MQIVFILFLDFIHLHFKLAEVFIVGSGLVIVLIDSKDMVLFVLFSLVFNLINALFLGVEHLS